MEDNILGKFMVHPWPRLCLLLHEAVIEQCYLNDTKDTATMVQDVVDAVVQQISSGVFESEFLLKTAMAVRMVFALEIVRSVTSGNSFPNFILQPEQLEH